MSAALERVIEEQQQKIDWLEACQESLEQASLREGERLMELLPKAMGLANYQFSNAMLTQFPTELKQWYAKADQVRDALIEFGLCRYCNELGCDGECNFG